AIDFAVALFENLAIPGEVGWHAGPARSAGNQLQPAVDHPHLPRDIARLPAVVARLQLADLPRAVHLVAEAPIAHVVRPLVAMRPPQLAPLGASVDVAVLDIGDCHLRGAGAEVHP